MAEEQRYTHPLVAVVLCCTSIHPEARSILASKATSMGALHRHDLTSDVTHLIVGDLNTPKYKYVARHRPDVKVVDTKWVDAMHEKWLAGEDIDVAEYEVTHRYPTFCGLRVSVTNISDVDERAKIQEILADQSAAYHPDLTRVVTHLIAAEPTGNKYEFAKQWKIRIVSPEWFYDSLERGMALDESYYDPLMPQEMRGVGAKPVAIRTINTAKLPAVDDETEGGKSGICPQLQLGKRQIRKKLTDTIGVQSQSLWNDIIAAAGSTKLKKRDEWDDASERDRNDSTSSERETKHAQPTDTDVNALDRSVGDSSRKEEQGMFSGMLFCVYGFDDKKASVLNSVISVHSGLLISPQELEVEFLLNQKPEHCFVIAPNIFPRSSYPEIAFLLKAGISTLIVSYWWLEACLHKKEYFYPEPPQLGKEKKDILYFPFESMPLPGFEGIEVTITGFSGVELLHVSKIIDLIGAKYDGNLNAQCTNVVIANTLASVPTRSAKADAAAEWGIPVVSVSWLWSCLLEGKRLEFEAYVQRGSIKRSLSVEDGASRKRARPKDGVDQEVDAQRGDVGGNDRSNSDTTRGYIDKGNSEILKGCVVLVSTTLEDRALELKNIMTALGASVVENLSHSDAKSLTHFIFAAENGRPSDDYKIATRIPNCHIVSPEWLQESLVLRKKADETKFSSRIRAAEGSATVGDYKSSSKISSLAVKNAARRQGPFVQDDEDGEESMSISNSRTLMPFPSESNEVRVESDAKASVVKELLKMDQEELSSAFNRRRKPRAKLQGRATSNISSTETNLSRTNSVGSAIDEVAAKHVSVQRTKLVSLIDEAPDTMTVGGGANLTQPPLSQIVSYADPEAQKEKRKMIAKLSGGAEIIETPEPVKVRVVQGIDPSRRTTRSNH